MPPQSPPHVVIVNQHGDNRGDEAAMVAMVDGLAAQLPGARFTIVHQFADSASEVPLAAPVEYVRMRLPPWQYLPLIVFAVALRLGFRLSVILPAGVKAIVRAIGDADVVISAPGGPYFGDLYADHEIAHWLLVWVAHLEEKPLGLYASSCGPFEHRVLNVVRRRGYRWFDEVVLREDRSAEMYRRLTGDDPRVTIDSALQAVVAPANRSEWAGEDELLLVVAVRQPPGAHASTHDEAVVAAIDHVATLQPTSVVFMPQLHGSTHRDAPYLRTLADSVRGARSVTVLPETADSDAQRALVAAADLVIAGRYHPAVFAVSAATPVLVIPYEHKATGLADAAGISRWVIPLESLDASVAASRAEELVRDSEQIRAHLRRRSPVLRDRAQETSVLMATLVPDS